MAESISIRRTRRDLAEVVPPPVAGVQANVCRTPGCPNFGVAPFAHSDRSPAADRIGRYQIKGARGATTLRCPICGRQFGLISNRALFYEVRRVAYGNDVMLQPACPNPRCENSHYPANVHPERYLAHGTTSLGRPRRRCGKCGKTFTIGGDHRSWNHLEVNKPIVLDLVNRASFNAILRKTRIGGKRLYERISFIHQQMLAFERYRLTTFRDSSAFRKRRLTLCTDAQDQLVNWLKHERREHVVLSCISTADNLTGFVFRSDVNLDPTIGDCGKHFEELEARDDFDTVERLGLSARYELAPFLRAAFWCLKNEEKPKPKRKSKDEDQEIATDDQLPVVSPERAIEIAKAKDAIRDMLGGTVSDEVAGHPPRGVIIRRNYTALAHFIALNGMLPPDARLHLVTDAGGSLVSGLLNGMRDRIKRGADVTLVMFDKELTHPKKQARVAAFKKQLDEFAQKNWPDIKKAGELRRAFLRAFAKPVKGPVGIHAAWWSIPIESMYEPAKRVGIVHQRPMKTTEIQDSHFTTLLERSTLHAVDSFFNFMRQRVSYLHRPGRSRSSQSFYNPFQPYRADMLQKIVDIARVYYNWVEPRRFRVEKKFDNVEERNHKSKHELMAAFFHQFKRAEIKEALTTPAMRLGLARGPVSLESILYGDWLSKCFAGRKPRRSRNFCESKNHIQPKAVVTEQCTSTL